MSSKVVEANAGIHSLAMAVAVRPSPSSAAAVIVAQWKPALSRCFVSVNPYLAGHELALVRYVRDSFLRHPRLSFIIVQFSHLTIFFPPTHPFVHSYSYFLFYFTLCF